MLWLKQSTSITVKIGPFVDDADGNTVEDGLTIAQADVRLSKNGGDIAQKTEATSCTHDELGIYGCPLDTTDTGTLGRLQLWVHESGALPVWHEFMVVSANTWDSFFAAENLDVNAAEISDDSAAADNLELACDNYSATRGLSGTALPAAAADAAGGLPISDAGALDLDTQIGTDIDAILADTNELQGDDVPTLIGALNDPTAAEVVNEWETQSQADPTGFHVNVMESLSQPTKFDVLYGGPRGPGIWIDAGANTNTVSGVDGIHSNPVSTFTAARTIANALGYKTYYLVGGVALTLAATHEDWHFIGLGEPTANQVNLGSQDVDRSSFVNVEVVGTQGGTERIAIIGGAIGAGTTLHVFACGAIFDGNFSIDTSSDNVFDQCFSGIAGGAAPVITATGAAGTAVFRHYSGGIEFASLSASHNISVETDGQVIFNANCNVNADVVLRGNMTITDNTAGMNNLSRDAALNGAYVNAQADTALTDYDGPTDAEMIARTLVAASYFDPAADAVANVTLVATTTTNTDVRGTDNAALASVCTEARLAELAAANLPTDVDAILADTNELQTDWADDGRLDLLLDGASAPSAATVADAVWNEASAGHTDAGKAGQQLWTDLDAVLADTNELQTDNVPALVGALNDVAVTDITQRQIPDSVPTNGTRPTIEQALYMVTQFLHERAVSGTTVTVKKVDGSTSLLTLTLDDDTDPTSITRAS